METKYIIGLALAGVLVVFGLMMLAETSLPPEPEAQAPFYPEPTNYVVDSAGVLTSQTFEKLNADLKTLDEETGNQIAVAVVKTTAPLTVEQYSIELAERWQPGTAEEDNGILVVLATEDRKVRIEVGQGHEGIIPDAVAGRMLDEHMIPHLKENKWNEAVVSIVDALKSKITE